jgi:flagellar FliL protein
MTSLTMVSTSADFKNRVARNEAQLRDTACGILSTKTITDLEKPGARNIIRSELITAFNNVFGDTVVQEVYFTEFAIQ